MKGPSHHLMFDSSTNQVTGADVNSLAGSNQTRESKVETTVVQTTTKPMPLENK